jgi:hypothetical protein
MTNGRGLGCTFKYFELKEHIEKYYIVFYVWKVTALMHLD